MELPEIPCQHERHEQRPEPQGNHVLRLAQLEPANADHQQVSHHQVEHSPQHVITDDDKPCPGGDANGLWNGLAEMPFTRCGMVFARKAPPKK